MSNVFVASNGVTVQLDGEGDLKIHNEWYMTTDWICGDDHIAAVSEYFQHQRDEELGRWRDSKRPDFVCYPWRHGHISVLDETTGVRSWWTRGEARKDWNEPPRGFATARAYYAAHPGPTPWKEAKAGEVWLLTIKGAELTAVCGIVNEDRVFFCEDGAMLFRTDKNITAGNKVWPTKEEN